MYYLDRWWCSPYFDLYTTGFSSIDFGGYFPAVLMNMILSKMISQGKVKNYKKLKSIDD